MINYSREGVSAYKRSLERLSLEHLCNFKWVHRVSTFRDFVPTSTDEMLALKMRFEGCYLLRCREVLFLSSQRRMALANKVLGESARAREREREGEGVRERERGTRKTSPTHTHTHTHLQGNDTLAFAMRSESQRERGSRGLWRAHVGHCPCFFFVAIFRRA